MSVESIAEGLRAPSMPSMPSILSSASPEQGSRAISGNRDGRDGRNGRGQIRDQNLGELPQTERFSDRTPAQDWASPAKSWGEVLRMAAVR